MREFVCVCVCVWERERQSACACMLVCLSVCVRLCVILCVCVCVCECEIHVQISVFGFQPRKKISRRIRATFGFCITLSGDYNWVYLTNGGSVTICFGNVIWPQLQVWIRFQFLTSHQPMEESYSDVSEALHEGIIIFFWYCSTRMFILLISLYRRMSRLKNQIHILLLIVLYDII